MIARNLVLGGSAADSSVVYLESIVADHPDFVDVAGEVLDGPQRDQAARFAEGAWESARAGNASAALGHLVHLSYLLGSDLLLGKGVQVRRI